jgi:hypothetical protein
MNRYKVINTHSEKHNNVVLHEDILDILFKYKIEVHKKLIDLRGAFLIDHIAIKIIDPDNKMVILSLTPSVEYNLLVQGLWKYDKSFCPNFTALNSLYLWEDAYSVEHAAEIKNIKQLKHGFTFGFNLAKKIDSFHFIYSYATRSKNQGLQEYYIEHIQELLTLGDFGYRLIRDIYAKFCNPKYSPPSAVDKKITQRKPILKLITNESAN